MLKAWGSRASQLSSDWRSGKKIQTKIQTKISSRICTRINPKIQNKIHPHLVFLREYCSTRDLKTSRRQSLLSEKAGIVEVEDSSRWVKFLVYLEDHSHYNGHVLLSTVFFPMKMVLTLASVSEVSFLQINCVPCDIWSDTLHVRVNVHDEIILSAPLPFILHREDGITQNRVAFVRDSIIRLVPFSCIISRIF